MDVRRALGAVLSVPLAAAVLVGTVGSAPTAAAAAPTTRPGMFVPVRPLIAWDQAVGGGVEFSARVTVSSDAPASAAVLNVTITDATAVGLATFYPLGAPRPATSNLNFAVGTTVRNLVVTGVSASGSVAGFLNTTGRATVRIDVVGYYTAGTPVDPGAFTAVPAARLLDTRSGLGAPAGPVVGGGTVEVQVTGRGGVPAAGVAAALLNVRAAEATAPGRVTAFPAGAAVPGTTSLNFPAGQTVPNLVLVPVGAGGRVALRVAGTTGTVQLLADVAGYTLAGTPTEIGSLAAIPAQRLIDTRSGLNSPPGPMPADSLFEVGVTGQAGIPVMDVSAVVLNVTVTQPTGAGMVVVSGPMAQGTSYVSYDRGQTVGNLVVVPLSPTGRMDVSINGTGTAQVIVDVEGYYVGGPDPSFVWSFPTPPAGDFTSPWVSCPSVIFCAAVTTGRRAALLRGTWAAPAVIDEPGSQTRSLTCPTATFCMLARGTAGTPGEVITYDGTTWSAPAQALPDRIRTLSCASPTFCVALSTSDRYAIFNGTAWSAPGTLPGSATVTSVSCPTTGHCVAVGGGTSDLPGPGVAWTLDAGTWSAPTRVTADGIGNLSCPTTDFCTAVTGVASIVVLDAGTWSDPVPVAPGSGGIALSCGAAGFCLALDSTGRAYEIHRRAVGRPAQIATANDPPVTVSCATRDYCMALTRSGRTLLARH